MRNINNNLKRRLADNVTSFSTCIKLKLKNSKILGFTDNIFDIKFEDVTYKSNSGFNSSAIENSNNLAADNLEFSGFLNSDIITAKAIKTGLYDHAYVEIFVVDYNFLNLGKIILKAGYLGEVKMVKNQFIAEVSGISQKLNNNIGKLYSPTCRAKFCGAECGLNKSNMKSVCNKTFETCYNVYDNAINFRGEPHLPGVDAIMKTAGTFR